LQPSKAISQALSIVIVIVIILAAFGGYAVGFEQKSPQKTTVTMLTSNTLQTVTEVEIVEWTGYYTQYISSNCTTGGGTISLSNPSTSTMYILPSTNVSGTLLVTITTTQSRSTTVSTVVIYAKPPPEPIQEVNGTITTTTIETCPTYA
jgi:hypothetical protein